MTAQNVISGADRQVDAAGDDDERRAQRQDAVHGRRLRMPMRLSRLKEVLRGDEKNAIRTIRLAKARICCRAPWLKPRTGGRQAARCGMVVTSSVPRPPGPGVRSRACRRVARVHDVSWVVRPRRGFAGEPALAHDGDPVAHAQDLRQLGRDHDDRLALGREVVQQLVDLVLRADVDAARRLVEDQDLAVPREPLRDDDLLLVAAGQVLDDLGRRRAS